MSDTKQKQYLIISEPMCIEPVANGFLLSPITGAGLNREYPNSYVFETSESLGLFLSSSMQPIKKG